MPRTLSFSVLALVTAAGLGLAQGARAEDPEPCAAKEFKTAQVKKACTDGGRPAAKDLMKKVVKKGKDAGEEINCKTCHSDLKTFALTDGALDHLKKLL